MPEQMKIIQLDRAALQKHHDLESSDKCFHWRYYTVHQGFNYGETNQLIANLKHKPTSSGARLKHKNEAIHRVAGEILRLIPYEKYPKFYDEYMFVPVPGSKAKSHPDYDNRLIQVLNLVKRIGKISDLDVREVVLQKESADASHSSGPNRKTIDELCENYEINNSEIRGEPKKIVIFDDVLTKGSHFKAVQKKLKQIYGDEIDLIGLFIARSVAMDDEI